MNSAWHYIHTLAMRPLPVRNYNRPAEFGSGYVNNPALRANRQCRARVSRVEGALAGAF